MLIGVDTAARTSVYPIVPGNHDVSGVGIASMLVGDASGRRNAGWGVVDGAEPVGDECECDSDVDEAGWDPHDDAGELLVGEGVDAPAGREPAHGRMSEPLEGGRVQSTSASGRHEPSAEKRPLGWGCVRALDRYTR